MELTNYILESADVADVDIMDIDVAQAFAEMAVLEAMMDCYEKQMVLLEYNYESAEEIFTESASIAIPQMPEYFAEAYAFQAVKEGTTWAIKRFDKTTARKLPGSNKWDPRTSKVYVDENGNECSKTVSSAAVNGNENFANQIANRLNSDRSLTNPDEKTRKTAPFSKSYKQLLWEATGSKKQKKGPQGPATGDIDEKLLAELIGKAEAEKTKKSEEAAAQVEKALLTRQREIEAEANRIFNDPKYSIHNGGQMEWEKCIRLATQIVCKRHPITNNEVPAWKTVDTPSSAFTGGNGRDYSQPSGDPSSEEYKPSGPTPRTDVAKKSFGNSFKAFMSKAGDLAMRFAAFIVDSLFAINFEKLGTKFSDDHSAGSTVKLSASDAAVIDGFEQFVDIVNWYDTKFRTEYLDSMKGQWTNNNVSRKLNELKKNTETLKNINKTDNKEDESVAVDKIVDICKILGRNELKKKLRTFQRNSTGFKTDLAVDSVPTALANAMREFIKILMKTYKNEATAVKKILKVAKDNDAVNNNSNITVSTNDAAEKMPAWAEEGWSMGTSEDEDFFLTESSYGSGYEDEDFYTESVPWNDENRRELWMSPQERERDKAMNPEKYASSNPLWRPARELSGAIFVRRGRDIDKYQCDRVAEKAKELLSSGQLHDQNVVTATKKLISEMGKCEQYSQDQLKKILIGYRNNVFSKSPEINHALNGR